MSKSRQHVSLGDPGAVPAIRARVSTPVLRAQLRLVEVEFDRLQRSPVLPAELKATLGHLKTLLQMLVSEVESW